MAVSADNLSDAHNSNANNYLQEFRMNYTEAKEHAEGRLHQIFAMPYEAFDNDVPERKLHLRVALQALLGEALREKRLSLQVLHGWENGACAAEDLHHHEHKLHSKDDIAASLAYYRDALANLTPLPVDTDTLLAGPLANAIASAEQNGASIDAETRDSPARWPDFPRGLALYTFFKVYHRLTYGEDDAYRSICCKTAAGLREIHEFHLEEGEFAIIAPLPDDPAGDVKLVLHVSQVEPVLALLGDLS